MPTATKPKESSTGKLSCLLNKPVRTPGTGKVKIQTATSHNNHQRLTYNQRLLPLVFCTEDDDDVGVIFTNDWRDSGHNISTIGLLQLFDSLWFRAVT